MAKQTVRQTCKTQRRTRALRKRFDGKFIGDNDATSNARMIEALYMKGAFAGGRWVHLSFEEQALLT